MYFLGDFYKANVSDKCLDLPIAWQNRASSLLTNKCIVVFTTRGCKKNKESQIFSQLNFDVSFSHPNKIPSFNFNGSLYDSYFNIYIQNNQSFV